MNNLKMYCICLHDGLYRTVKDLGYIPVGLGEKNFNKECLSDKTDLNISGKNIS